MIQARGFAAHDAHSPLKPYSFSRRELSDNDVLIDIQYCGICHSDIHQARNEWGNSTFPMVPGHEIVGTIREVGRKVSRFKEGDSVGVGCFIDSCRECASCKEGLEQYCEGHLVVTYNGIEKDMKTATQGGYSNLIVVDENYVLRVSHSSDLPAVAPLLCAGITTYSPLRRWNVGKGQRVGVVGLGGLGHMGVKLAASFGADVTVLSTSPSKQKDAERLGAHDFLVTKDEKALAKAQGRFDFILNTVAAVHNVDALLSLLKRDGTMVMVGAPEKPLDVHVFSLIMKRRNFAGSLIGGIRETQEMLDYCAQNNIVSDIEMISIDKVNEAYDRTVKGDVRYRFVIDMNSLS